MYLVMREQFVMESILLESGAKDNVWVYVYRGSTTGKRKILSGDYFKEVL